MKQVLRCAVILAALASAAFAQQRVKHFVAHLTGDRAVPRVTTSADGFAIVTVDTGAGRMDVLLHCVGLVGTRAQLRVGANGYTGPVILTLNGGPDTWTASGPIPGNYAAVVTVGFVHLNVETAANPSGEIRGDLVSEAVRRCVVRLDGSQEVPPNASSATGMMEAFLHLPSRVLMYELNTTGMQATAAHIHTGVPGVNGPVLFPLSSDSTRACGVTPRLSDAAFAALETGGLYVNVHSAAFPGGEIRGQILYGNDEYSAVLSGLGFFPPTGSLALGRACVRVLPSGAIEYRVDTSGLVATAANLHRIDAANGDPVIVQLAGGPTSWAGVSAPLSAAHLVAMGNGQTYIQVQTAAFPDGEIRGGLIGAEPYRVYGMGCPSASGQRPEIGARGMACLGENFTPRLAGGPASQPAALLLGFRRDSVLGGSPLPVDLSPVGMSGCFLFHDNPGISMAASTDALGCAEVVLPIPGSAPFGVRMFAQWLVIAPGANPAGIGASNGMDFPLR